CVRDAWLVYNRFDVW
nr:immunoglobulin heavy chain junction region [Macaca mulatta]